MCKKFLIVSLFLYFLVALNSIEHLIMRHKDRVFGFIMSKVKDVDISNDIFQEVFIKVINKLKEGRYNEEGKFLSGLGFLIIWLLITLEKNQEIG